MVEMKGVAFWGSQCSGLLSHGLHTCCVLIFSLMKSRGPLGFCGCLCYPRHHATGTAQSNGHAHCISLLLLGTAPPDISYKTQVQR